MSELRVFTFSSDWGLPTTGPFALKLLAWLRLHAVPYEQVFENNPRKGPRGKSPWVEYRGERIADSGAIIARLAADLGIAPTPGRSARDEAIAHAFQTAFEERFHQILEWELFVHPAGARYIDEQVKRELPPIVANVAGASMKRHFARQLHARGIARHSEAAIADLGRTEVDALSAILDGQAFLAGDAPALADLSVFGQVAPMVRWPMRTPVADYLKHSDTVRGWVERLAERCFGANEGRQSPAAPAPVHAAVD